MFMLLIFKYTVAICGLSVINFPIPNLAYSLMLSVVINTDLLHPEKFSNLVYFAQITKILPTVLLQNYSCNFFEKYGNM